MEKIKQIALEKMAALKKALLMLILLGLLGGIIFFAYQYVMTEGEEEFSPTEIIETAVAKEKPAERKKAKAEKTVAMTIPTNPFISSKELSAKATEKISSTTEVKTEVQSQSPTQMVLPQIPKTQVVQSQPVKLPETRTIVNPMTMETKEVPIQNEGNVQGVITTDNGKNIAIMSNGEVLSEGERYLDGRIAYIGGDGIEMDNGRKIKLKE